MKSRKHNEKVISWCLCGTWNGIVRELLWREWIIISQPHCIWEKGYKRMENSQEALYCCYGCHALRLGREISEAGMQGRSVGSKWSHKRKSHTGLESMSWLDQSLHDSKITAQIQIWFGRLILRLHISSFIYTFIHTYLHMHKHIYIYIYICIHTCIHTYWAR